VTFGGFVRHFLRNSWRLGSCVLAERNAQNFDSGVFYSLKQGCQMVCFQTKNPNLRKFWRALDWKMFIYYVGNHLEYFMEIWDIL
jgi:hypothetical protein